MNWVQGPRFDVDRWRWKPRLSSSVAVRHSRSTAESSGIASKDRSSTSVVAPNSSAPMSHCVPPGLISRSMSQQNDNGVPLVDGICARSEVEVFGAEGAHEQVSAASRTTSSFRAPSRPRRRCSPRSRSRPKSGPALLTLITFVTVNVPFALSTPVVAEP